MTAHTNPPGTMPTTSASLAEDWRTQVSNIEQLARAQGLKYHPVEFEVVPGRKGSQAANVQKV